MMELIPLMMTALQLEASPNALKFERTRFIEFLACQVKTLSFLTYLLRGFAEFMRRFVDAALHRIAVTPTSPTSLTSLPPSFVCTALKRPLQPA